ncbi:hypothetical protein MPSEU_000393700 [Mayamaea pseudoterrestris]|nr:hypothetical protein MPSEU_000393700 [Mayamaea pseudoterrestris]
MWRLFGNKNNASATAEKDDASTPREVSDTDTFRAWGDGHAGSNSNSSQRHGTSNNFLSLRDKNRLDKEVGTAARNLGDGVQKIVLAAKSKEGNSIAWKAELLTLLGATCATTTEDDDDNPDNLPASDIDILLKHSTYEHFVARCVENELPPNLVHCMRLLRVVELQHASEQAATSQTTTIITPIAVTATTKVSKLLCCLCVNVTVGEQLRPHLFGLLALSGASYPESGVHVAKAASEVIIAVADGCLSRQLVWFIHDRRMIMHMTDDVKELCGIAPTEIEGPAAIASAASKGLTGADAEKHGLWYIALETIVKLLVASCRFLTVDLVNDFEEAGGYDVLRFAIKHGTNPHGAKLVELLPALACCPGGATIDNAEKVASNTQIFEILEELLVGSNPLLRECKRRQNDTLPYPIADMEPLSDLAAISIEVAMNMRSAASEIIVGQDEYAYDAMSALLSAILQIFSDHPRNYEILEGRQHVLSYSVLALPCVANEETKMSILKTLEFVLTAIEIKNETTPLTAYVEVFFALCQALLSKKSLSTTINSTNEVMLLQDLTLMGNTLEKLLQFDQRVAPLMTESFLVINLPKFVELLEAHTLTHGSNGMPLSKTEFDSMFSIVSNLVRLLVSQQAVAARELGALTIHRLLRYAINELGNDAVGSIASAYEVFMSSSVSLDMHERELRFVFTLLRELGEPLASSKFDTDGQNIALERLTVVLLIVRSSLESTQSAREAFRTCEGFETILSVVLCMEGMAMQSDYHQKEVLKCLKAVFGTLDAAFGMKNKDGASSIDACPVILPCNIFVDPVSSQSSFASPGALNRSFVRQCSFYSDLAAAIFGTAVMETESSSKVMDLCLRHIDAELKVDAVDEPASIRNPDAIRLLLRMTLFLSEADNKSAEALQTLEPILRACGDEATSSNLRSLATCGLACSLTSPDEFAPLLFTGQSLQPLLLSFLRRLASFNMSYRDFVGLLRSVLGPLLMNQQSEDRIILPVISSSVGKSMCTNGIASSPLPTIDRLQDDAFCERLRFASEIAEFSNAFPLVRVGGDSINSIGVLLHDVDVDDRLRRVAQESRLAFVEITSLDAKALQQSASPTEDTTDKVWAPLLGSGFSFSTWLRLRSSDEFDGTGNLYIFDVCAPTNPLSANQERSYLSVWYDLSNKRFTVVSSASYRGEPTCFPVSPLTTDVWHHVLLTYLPSKRTMMSRKSSFSLFINGRALEAEVRIDSVTLPLNASVIIGAPNPTLAASGIVRGRISPWELGPCILLSMVLLDLDAAAVHACGPNFPSILWGDRPQRMSLAATGTLTFSLLAETGEPGSIASALKRRNIQKLEGAGLSTTGPQESDRDDLSAVGLLCVIPPDCVVFAYQALAANSRLRNDVLPSKRTLHFERLVNLARLNFSNDNVATDAIVYGKDSLVTSVGFSDCLFQAGGPDLLTPLVDAASSPRSLAYALRLIRQGTNRHPPNLESMQIGGGYRILAVLIKERGLADISCLDECLAFAVTGFAPSLDFDTVAPLSVDVQFDDDAETSWVLSDVDAMKHLLLNHQVWDLQRCGPSIPLRLLSALNVLVSQKALHKSFNARRLHLVGIIRWALHLMIEGAELYSASEVALQRCASAGDIEGIKQVKQGWYSESPLVSDVTVGGDPGNSFLLDCKKLLRRVLTFMLTPGDLEAVADGIIFTLAISGSSTKVHDIALKQGVVDISGSITAEERMRPGPTARLYLVRLLEELIVDGVNEIVANAPPAPQPKHSGEKSVPQNPVRYHSGGVASPNQPYLSTLITRGKSATNQTHPKHQQAQAFLSAFSGFLTPVWFATVLEGCHEEATASATLRLMILMLQGSSAFESIFWTAGGFSPFVLSVPKFATCPGITLTLLSELLNVPILHLPFFARLDPEQLCEVFDSESSEYRTEQVSDDPSSEIFGLLAECIGRNIKYMSNNAVACATARETNAAVIYLIAHRHEVSPAFQQFCTTRNFLEPLSQALCLIYNERMSTRPRRRVMLSATPKDIPPTERFVGTANEVDDGSLGMVRLLRMVILDAMVSAPSAALVLHTMFQSFPIHASAQQVEALHLILIEQCQSVIQEVLEYGDAVFMGNCVGLCSVLLNQQTNAYFTAEASLESVKIALSILETLIDSGVQASASLDNAEHTLLTTDAAHIAGLMCVAALKMTLPMSYHDPGDEDFQAVVLALIEANIDALLLVQPRERKARRRVPSTSTVARPPHQSRLFPTWLSASFVRCTLDQSASYPDISDNTNSQVVFVAPLIIVLQRSLNNAREDIRGPAVSILVALLQHRLSVMSELLVAEIKTGNQVETIDVVNRGGFRALLTAHEAASVSNKSGATASSVKKKYSSFFEWFERNQSQVDLVFKAVDERVARMFPEFSKIATPHDEAIENKQKLMLLKLTTHTSDNSILGGIERGELARRSAERTTDSHARWKRQGFDDLAYGATKWKTLLRQLKGSGSIWEGGPQNKTAAMSSSAWLASLKARNGKPVSHLNVSLEVENVNRWKLDLSEGSEQQRRRLLPNYEFHGIYNLDGSEQCTNVQGSVTDALDPTFFVNAETEATAELLKDLNIKRALSIEEEELDYDGVVSAAVDANALNFAQAIQEEARDTVITAEDVAVNHSTDKADNDHEDSSSYGLITGLLQPGDWPEKSYNVRRCTGLEVTKALLLWCQDALYIIDGFEQVGGFGMDGKITRVDREQSSFNINLRPKNFKVSEEKSLVEIAALNEERMLSKNTKQGHRLKSSSAQSPHDVLYQHRSQRISFSELYSVYRRRYQLQHTALEFHDVHRKSTLVAFSNNDEREEVLTKVLQSKLPKSIFSSSYGNFISYTKFMNNLKAKVVSQWVNRKMTNFEFIMHLNSFAGRTFNDLTQYPVFPWVIADYDSDEIDLDDPATYRDLSKPMGGIGEQRAQQFRERYDALASTCFTDDDPPPFHYGTHYSCAAYVLYYLMRLEPFSRLALSLQGGRFDLADRLFHDVGRSWKSASTDNLQDVRELIPEFFYLPDFLTNTNHFDFGETQRGKTVHDVSLPKWAKGDPQLFVRINRQALESEYVSRNLHHWADLIFGYKQRGSEAVKSMNVFVHVTYEGQVDLESMEDPVQKASTIAQIQNFGQTPSRLERRPFPQRIPGYSSRGRVMDMGTLLFLASLTPPFCIVGAPNRVSVECVSTDTCRLGLYGQSETAVGDICLINKLQLVGVGRMCALMLPSKRYVRFGGINNGVSIHSCITSARSNEPSKSISFHDALHRTPITAAKASLNGDWLVTGGLDSTLKVWRYADNRLSVKCTLCGHEGSHITCIDISTEFGMIASGCGEGSCLLWDLRTYTFVRRLEISEAKDPVISISINNSNGNVVTLVGSLVTIFDINGNLIARLVNHKASLPTCAVSTNCPEWMENGISVVTGHEHGEILFWSIDYTGKQLDLSATLEENVHVSAITVLRVTSSGERQDSLLSGDISGKVGLSKTKQLENIKADEMSGYEEAQRV